MKIKFIPKLPRLEMNNVHKIWRMELIFTCLVLSAFLAFDLWIYFQKAEANRDFETPPDASKVISLKKGSLEAIDKKLQGYKAFLNNPKFNY